MAEKDEEINDEELVIYNPLDKRQNTVIKNFKLVELQKDIYKDGALVYTDPTINEKKAYCNQEMNKLYPEVRRELYPDIYKVSATKKYVDDKENLINKVKTKVYKREF